MHDACKSYLIDLGSSQGTYIGSTRLKGFTPTLITNKSFIRFGPSGTQFMFRSIPSERYIVELAARIPCREEQKLFLNTQFNLFHLAASNNAAAGNPASSLLMQHVIVRGGAGGAGASNSATPRCRRSEGCECFCASAGSHSSYYHEQQDSNGVDAPLLCGAIAHTPVGERAPGCPSLNLHDLVTEEFVPDAASELNVDTLPPLDGMMELSRMATWCGPEDNTTNCSSSASSTASSTSSLTSLSEPHDDFCAENDEESMDVVSSPALAESVTLSFAPLPSLSIATSANFHSSPLTLKQQCFTPAAGLKLGGNGAASSSDNAEAHLQQHLPSPSVPGLRIRAQTSDNELNTVVALSNECIKRCAEEAGVDVDDYDDCANCDADFEVDDPVACTTVIISPSKTFKKGQTYSPVPTPRKLVGLSIGNEGGASFSRNSFSNSSLSSGVSLGDLGCALGCMGASSYSSNDSLGGSSSVSSDGAMSEFDDDVCGTSQGSGSSSSSSTNKLGRMRFAKKVRFSDSFVVDARSSSDDNASLDTGMYSFGRIAVDGFTMPSPVGVR